MVVVDIEMVTVEVIVEVKAKKKEKKTYVIRSSVANASLIEHFSNPVKL